MALNPEDILKEQFPDNVSISDLCDCGCYKDFLDGKAVPFSVYGKHKRRPNGPPPIPRKSVPLPETDYRSTFKGVAQRPRSSKRPLTEVPMRPLPKEPMFFDTNQRADFKSHGHIERTKPIIPEEKFEPSTAKIDGTTSYAAEFIPKQLQPEFRRMEPRSNYVPSNAKFEKLTTNKEHYKKWVPTKQVPFGEMPSFTGSILYPQMKEKYNGSETMDAFKGEFVKRPDAIRLAEANIKMEGDMFLNTTNHDTFTKHDGDHRSKRTTHSPSLKVSKNLGKIETQTQNRRDFPQYLDAERARMAEPAPCTIDLKFDNKRSLTTEQRDIFKGHDVLVNPMAKAIRTDYADYEPPTVKFETETCNKRDYVPKEIPKVLMKVAPREGQIQRRDDIRFDDRTMNKEFFKNWGPGTRVRYGDFHENRPYIPPQTKFEGASVTKSCFIPKKYEFVKDFRPEHKEIAKDGEIDFQTVHRETYIKPVIKPCRAQLFLLQRELKKLRQEREGSAPPAISAK